jgi:tetratricopeptide (TPR) repeat protein
MRTKNLTYCILGALLLLFSFSAIAQKKKKGPENPYSEEARNLVIDGNDYASEDAFAKAESSYRQAIGLDPASVPAKYNAGNNYYSNKKFEESISSHLKSAQVATTKKEKHKAFHNLGNAYYQKEDYAAAVEAYKNALRNDPTDDETRYNLALAKKEEEKNGGGGGGGDDDEEQEDQDQNKEKEKNEENKDGDGDKKEGEDGEEEETDDEGEEKEDEGEQKEDEDGKEQEKEKEQPGDKGDEKEKAPQKPQPQQGQLTPQQVKNLLEAMRNEEQKTQEKINARKQKGAKVKTEKDW